MATTHTRPTDSGAPPPVASGTRRQTKPPAKAPPPVAGTDAPEEQIEEATQELKTALKVELPENEDIWDALKNWPQNHWQRTLIYLYRTSPIIDRRSNGRRTNIAKYTACIDPERVKLDHGSGGYQMHVTYQNPVSGKYNRLALFNFDILDMNYPPRVPPGDWVEEPANEVWKWAGPLLQKEQAAQQQRAAGADPQELFKTVMDAVERLRPAGDSKSSDSMTAAIVSSLTEMQRTMLEMSDPGKQLTLVREIMGAMRPSEDNGTKMLLQMLLEDRKAQAAEMAEMRKVMMTPRKSIFEEITEIMPQLEKGASFLGFTKRHQPNAGTDWGNVALQVVDKLGEHLPTIATMVTAGKGGPGSPSNRGFNLNNRTPAAVTAPASDTRSSSAPAAETTQSDAPTFTDEERTQLEGILAEFQPLLTQITPFLIDKFQDPEEGGYEFRDWFIKKFGVQNWNVLRQKAPVSALVKLSQANDYLRGPLSPPEAFAAFLEEFFTNPGEEPTEALVSEGATHGA